MTTPLDALARPKAVHSLGKLLSFGLLIAIFLLTTYTVVDRFVVRGVPAESRSLADLINNTALLMMMAVATCVYVFAHWVPSLRSSLTAQDDGGAITDVFQRDALARWLLGMRWIAVIGVAAVVFFVSEIVELVPTGTSLVLWSLVALLAGFNAALAFLGPQRLTSQRAVAVQIGVDVGVLGVAIHQVGGVTNPLAGFFVFHTVIASLLLRPRLARAASACVAAFVIALTVLETSGWLAPGALPGSIAASELPGALQRGAAGFGIALLSVGCSLVVITLVDHLQRDRKRLGQMTHSLAAEADRLAQARVDLLGEREKLHTVMNCMADAMIFVTPDGEVALHNRAAEALWPEEPRGSVLRVCHYSAERWDRLREVVANPRPYVTHPTLHVGDRAYEANYARVCDPDGELLGVVMVARDVTDRLEEQNARVQGERMAAIGRLGAALAHELNNPVGAMVLFAEQALMDVEEGTPLSDHLGTVLRNARLCKKIVRDLLGYARQRPPERHMVPPCELIADVRRMLAPQCARSGVEVETSCPPDLDRDIWGDPDQLRQVLVNLGLNAIDAMPDGGTLRFVVEPDGRSEVRISVVDTGTGIPEDEREKVFTAFHTTKAQGTGLGLAVVRDLVAAHGGRVELHSVVGEGTTFTLSLPSLEISAGALPGPPTDAPTHPMEVFA